MKHLTQDLIPTLVLLGLPFSTVYADPDTDAALVALGEKLYFDSNLSTPPGQACASCHLPGAGFADPDRELAVSRGVNPSRFGDRNTPTASYALYSPTFHFDKEEDMYIGGQFLDGRAATLEEQAKAPFLNPVEMGNASANDVIRKVLTSDYVDQFKTVFGTTSLENTEEAFDNVASAIATFERSAAFHRFDSKYDAYLAGKDVFSEQEKLGLKIFEAEDKGNCAACHPSTASEDGTPPLFTDFTYDNVGVAKNIHSPFLSQSTTFNPDGKAYVDLGLYKTTKRNADKGKFKVSSLRNVELTPPYMHNGLFTTLREVVDFYNTRDTRADWGEPEVAENVNKEELGNLGLTNIEVDALVAFMKTLTDGFKISP